ncbi:MAG: amino acid permease [Chromatiales bacterium]|jgi:amino acid transporter|nr:amino acid permease [Chromatiales bacterium]MDP6151114.1 APC family permease [Gammaproteobacteria bacterium]HJP05016.1 APC family permease [Gammaproteobacteria bacterium]
MNGQLLRVLGRRDVIALAFGAIIGWSWVLLTGTWIYTAGSLGAMLAFLVGGVAMILIGLTYAELASAMPMVGGEHVYSHRAFGPGLSFICTWALILAYVTVVAFEPVALGVAIDYLWPEFTTGKLWNFAGDTVWLTWVVTGMSGALFLTFINVRGVRPAAFLQFVVTSIILLAGILFIAGTVPAGSVGNLIPLFREGLGGTLSVLIMVPMMFIGFDVIPQTAEEISLPYRAIGTLLVLSVCMAMAWYLLMILGVGLTFPADELENQLMATADASSVAWGSTWAGQLIVLGGIAGIISSWNAFLVAGSRVVYALARAGRLPGWLGELHTRYNTPHKAILLIGLFSFLAPLFGRQILVWCIDAGGFAVVIAYGIVAASFLVLRQREPEMERPYRLKHGLLVGWLALLLSCALLLVYLPGSPAALVWPYEWLILLGWSLLGLVFWRRASRDRQSAV